MIQAGDILYGFCGGYFGREYLNKLVVFTNRDCVVAKTDDYYVLAQGSTIHSDLEEYLTEKDEEY